MIKHRKRNYNTLKLRMEQRKFNKVENQNGKPTTEQIRIQRKLTKYQNKYKTNKTLKNEPWGKVYFTVHKNESYVNLFLQFQHKKCHDY